MTVEAEEHIYFKQLTTTGIKYALVEAAYQDQFGNIKFSLSNPKFWWPTLPPEGVVYE